nr:putative alcohol dehydrogenase [uncultured bacterium]
MVEHKAADVGEGFGLPPPHPAQIVLVEGFGFGVDQGGDGVEQGGVVESALDRAAGAGAVPPHLQLVDHHRRRIVGLRAVLVELFDQGGTPAAQLAGGEHLGLAASCSSTPARCPSDSRPAASDPSSPAMISTWRKLACPAANALPVTGSRAANTVPSRPIRSQACSAATTRRWASNPSHPNRSHSAPAVFW